MSLEQCANCRETIGEMEGAHLFRGRVVCSHCLRRLKAERFAPDDEAAPLPYATPRSEPYVDHLWGVRLLLLVAGLFWWPLLIAWAVLGVMHLVNKSNHTPPTG